MEPDNESFRVPQSWRVFLGAMLGILLGSVIPPDHVPKIMAATIFVGLVTWLVLRKRRHRR